MTHRVERVDYHDSEIMIPLIAIIRQVLGELSECQEFNSNRIRFIARQLDDVEQILRTT